MWPGIYRETGARPTFVRCYSTGVDVEMTLTLKNLAGIRDAALLEEYEGEMSIIRQFEFSENPPPSSFDLTHLRAIHCHLFQDVYAWAGEPRTVATVEARSRFGSHLHAESYLF